MSWVVVRPGLNDGGARPKRAGLQGTGRGTVMNGGIGGGGWPDGVREA